MLILNPGFQSSSVWCSHVSPWLESPRCLGRVYMNCALSCLIPSDICIAQILSAPSHFVICHHLLTTNQIYKYPSLPSPSPPTSESPHHPILLFFLWHPSWRAFNFHTSISICWSLIIVSADNASVGSKRGRDSKVMVRRYDAILRWPAPLITPSRHPWTRDGG